LVDYFLSYAVNRQTDRQTSEMALSSAHTSIMTADVVNLLLLNNPPMQRVAVSHLTATLILPNPNPNPTLILAVT